MSTVTRPDARCPMPDPRRPMPGAPLGLVILGATGSIGESTASVVKSLGPERVQVVGLAAGTRADKLAAMARDLGARFACAAPGRPFEALRELLDGTGIQALCGSEGQCQMVADPRCDTVLAAVTGAAGLPAVLEAARRGRRLCLSNKESLVVAGPLVRRLARAHGAELIPVDSEHSALFQALQSGRTSEVRRLILTASGGPFRTWSRERMATASIAQALIHPTWKMGPNITIDSATLMNKALELIEAQVLFDIPAERIEAIIHPQSIIHSLVEYHDGSVMAQLGVPDMRVPIQYALTYPQRAPLTTSPFDLAAVGALTFEAADPERFPSLALARRVMLAGGVAGAILNAANEVARGAFLEGRCGFNAIVATNARVLDLALSGAAPGVGAGEVELDTILQADAWARREAVLALS